MAAQAQNRLNVCQPCSSRLTVQRSYARHVTPSPLSLLSPYSLLSLLLRICSLYIWRQHSRSSCPPALSQWYGIFPHTFCRWLSHCIRPQCCTAGPKSGTRSLWYMHMCCHVVYTGPSSHSLLHSAALGSARKHIGPRATSTRVVQVHTGQSAF